jgi:rubrerythrin
MTIVSSYQRTRLALDAPHFIVEPFDRPATCQTCDGCGNVESESGDPEPCPACQAPAKTLVELVAEADALDGLSGS